MIKARLEARCLRIWLTSIGLVTAIAIIACAVVGFIAPSQIYDLVPELDLKLTIEGTIFGVDLPAWFTENFSFGVSLAIIIGALWLLLHIIYAIVLCALRGQRSKAKRVLRKTGYSKEYFDRLEHKHRQLEGTSLSARNDLLLAKEYIDGRRYDDAFAILRDINVEDFDSKQCAAYYTLYTKLFIMTGDLDGARKTLDMGSNYLNKYSADSEVRLVKALLKYAEGDYESARKRFENLLTCKPIETRVWAGLYLGLVYLRLCKKELAKKLAVTLSSYKKTPRQSEDMLKLLKKIEQAYALEEQEKAEAAE